MFIDANEIGPAEFRIDTGVRPPAEPEVGGLQWVRGRLHGMARRRTGGVELRARLEVALRAECSRCLEPVDIDICTDFTINIVPRGIEDESDDRELEPEEALLYESPDGKVDLDLVAREQAYLVLPLKPLCRPDCLGLCPACGVNRNLLECDCGARPIDPRWASLASFRFEDHTGES